MSRALVVFFGLAWLASAQAEIYRWTDDMGRVHYGERPPGRDAVRLELPESRSEPANVTAGETERRERQRRMLEAFEYERGRKAEQAAREADQRRRRQAACERLRAQWRRLSYPGPIYFSEDGGGRRYLDDAQRAAEKDRLRPFYQQACGDSPD